MLLTDDIHKAIQRFEEKTGRFISSRMATDGHCCEFPILDLIEFKEILNAILDGKLDGQKGLK